MLLTNTTLRSTASNTLARSFSLGVGGGTLESVTAGQIWTIQGPDAIDVGNESLTLTGAGNIVVDTGITGAGGVIKTGTGTATLFTASTYNGDTDVNAGILDVTGAHSGNGDFNANGGTLNLNDRAYEGVATGNFNLADGATLNFANTFRCGDGVAGTYTFNLGNGTVSGLENNATFFAGAAHTVNLLGAYQHTLQSTTVFTGQNIDYQGDPTLTVVGSNGGVDLASLNVPAGKKLSIQIANTNTQGNAALTATGNITIAQGDLTIDLDTLGYTVAPGRFDVFEGNWTNASPSWEILKDGYTISYVYANNVLFGTVNPIFEPSQEVTNPEAVMVISTGSPTPNSPTSDIKVAMQGATTTERDRIVQQFTPSMAAAGVIQNYNADRALLRLVGIELDNP